jgi:hypothetical protein
MRSQDVLVLFRERRVISAEEHAAHMLQARLQPRVRAEKAAAGELDFALGNLQQVAER